MPAHISDIPVEHVPESTTARITAPDSHRALCWLATLAAASIDYQIERHDASWSIIIAETECEAALRELQEYERINRDWPPPAFITPPKPEPRAGISLFSLLVALLLILIYGLTGPLESSIPVFDWGAAHSGQIRQGQWWRAFTALLLHADLPHVLGNAACCFFFGQALCRQLGTIRTWLLIPAAGTTANLISAFITPDYYQAIGASTATFAALGILATSQALRNWRHYHDLHSIWSKSWIAIGAGVAFLALLGTGPRADLAGHLIGFTIGALLGLVPPGRNRSPMHCQISDAQ